jgi:hypothetical protein
MACGLCLLIGPTMLLLATILDPVAGEGGDDDRAYLKALADDPDMAQLSTALWIYGFALVAIGIIGAVHVIRGRGVVLANLGGMLAIFGLIMFVALVTTTVNDINVAENLGVDAGVKLSDSIEDYWVAFVVLVPALLGTLIGFILLGVALIRSKLTHIAAGILIIVGILAVVPSEESQVIGIIANLLLLGGWGLVGLKLLGMSDAQWDGREPLDGDRPEAPLAAGPPPAV